MPFPGGNKYIVATEEQIGFTFPPKYRRRMLCKNGGEIETQEDSWRLFPFFDKSDKERMRRTADHIILENRNARQWRRFPKNAVAIGSDCNGNYLVLFPREDMRTELSEHIYMWDHETGEIDKLADSIEELEST